MSVQNKFHGFKCHIMSLIRHTGKGEMMQIAKQRCILAKNKNLSTNEIQYQFKIYEIVKEASFLMCRTANVLCKINCLLIC